MMRRLIFSLLSFFSLLPASARDRLIYEGRYNGERYTVREHITHVWMIGRRTDWRIRLGRRPVARVNIRIQRGTPITLKDAFTTDWGPPYSDDIFGDRARVYLTTPVYPTPDKGYPDTTAEQHDITMLYLTPAKFSKKDFDAYAAFMKVEWPKVDAALANRNHRQFPHIIGLALADRESIIHRFRGMYRGQPFVLRIDPDGYINMGPDDSSEPLNHVRNSPVQMPGKVISARTIYSYGSEGLKGAEIAGFTDKDGRRVDAFFKVTD